MDAFDLYLKQLKRYPKSIRPEIQNNLYSELDFICPNRLVNKQITSIPREAKSIVSEIAKHFYALVIHVAKRYYNYGHKLEFSDLVQDGNIGLMSGIWRYDNNQSCKLSSWNARWISAFIGRAINSYGYTIRIPSNIRDKARLLDGKEREFCESFDMLSLDADLNTFNSSANFNLYKLTISNSSEPDLQAERNALIASILSIIEVPGIVTAMEARVISLRFGLHDGDSRTGIEVSKKFGVSRQRIHQIEQEAIEKIKGYYGK